MPIEIVNPAITPQQYAAVDATRPGKLYQQALEAIRTNYRSGRISETIYTVRMTWVFAEFQAAPNAMRQIAVCLAALELCRGDRE